MQMQFPADIEIRLTIQQGTVYYFRNEELNSDKPHYYIVLNKNPRTDEVIFLTCASSKVEKRRDVIQKVGLPMETLVFIKHEEYKFFTEETVVDCNYVFAKDKDYLIEKMQSKDLVRCYGMMPQKVVEKLLQAVNTSPLVSEEVKKKLKSNQ